MAFVWKEDALIIVLAEKAREYNTLLYLCFADLRKAYDLVNRDALWAVLQKRYRIPEKLLMHSQSPASRNKRSCACLWQGVKGDSHQEWSKTRRCAGSYSLQLLL